MQNPGFRPNNIFSKDNQPATGNGDVIAYFYQGAQHTVMTVVNMSETNGHYASLTLRSSEANSKWLDIIPHGIDGTSPNCGGPAPGIVPIQATGQQLPIDMPAYGMRAFVRQN